MAANDLTASELRSIWLDGPDEPFGADDVIEPSTDFLQALEGDRQSSLAMWNRMADGEQSSEIRLWARLVAKNVVAAHNETNDAARLSGINEAVGLGGKLDRWRRVREMAAALRDFGWKREHIIAELVKQEQEKEAGPRRTDDLMCGLPDQPGNDDILDRELRKAPKPR